MKAAVVLLPGLNRDRDMIAALTKIGGKAPATVWQTDTSIPDVDLIVIPGGFSYGDYLRCGAIAARMPVMRAVADKAAKGVMVMGVCNGFQILAEAGLLPGALIRNVGLQYRCEWATVRVEDTSTPFTSACQPGQVLRMPISHGEGQFFADAETLQQIERNGQVLFRYCTASGELSPEANPNGSVSAIAGVRNAAGNVAALMPHPERSAEALLGGTDGLHIFESLLRWHQAHGRVA